MKEFQAVRKPANNTFQANWLLLLSITLVFHRQM